MSKYIVILTQDINNVSVQQIAAALRCNINTKKFQVLILDVNVISANTLLQAPIHKFSDIAFAIKRTFSPIRNKALAICEKLEEEGVPVFNECAFIRWSHSKIAQYKTSPHLFPQTVCFDAEFMRSIQDKDEKEVAQKVIKTLGFSKLTFPLVFKTSEGCRGDGIFLVETENALKALMEKLLTNPTELTRI